MGYLKLVGNKNSQNWTTELIYERDEKTGEVTGSIQAGVPSEVDAGVQKKFEDLGYIFESSSKKEADEAESNPVLGTDTLASGPVFDENTIDQPSSGSKK